jgi:catechol 2,3-dioxygenase-like lactoylglutathione lyase family enzyme
MDIEFIASGAPITSDPEASRRFYIETLGLPLEQAEGDEYFHSGDIGGSRHFGVWPLRQAAQACFGSAEWPVEHLLPQASIEFEVRGPEAVASLADELVERGHLLLHGAKVEPWGQTVARVLSPKGLIIGLSYAPWLHE